MHHPEASRIKISSVQEMQMNEDETPLKLFLESIHDGFHKNVSP